MSIKTPTQKMNTATNDFTQELINLGFRIQDETYTTTGNKIIAHLAHSKTGNIIVVDATATLAGQVFASIYQMSYMSAAPTAEDFITETWNNPDHVASCIKNELYNMKHL